MAFVFLPLSARGQAEENIIRAGAGFAQLTGSAHPQLSAGYGRRIAGPVEADLGAEIIVRPYGLIYGRVNAGVGDTLVLIPLGVRAVSPAVARRRRFGVGGGAAVFAYHARRPFPEPAGSAHRFRNSVGTLLAAHRLRSGPMEGSI